jgi:DNA-binding MarR family transcriptional regulator
LHRGAAFALLPHIERQHPLPERNINSGLHSGDRLVSRKILILANLLRRAAAARYRRLLRLAGVEWGLVAHLGQTMPQTLNQIAAGMGLEKAQLSRTVSTLVRRGLVSKKINPHNNREVLISLTREGGRHSRIIHTAGEAANGKLLADFSGKELSIFVERVERLTERARALLRSEQATVRGGDRAPGRQGKSVKRRRS